MVNNEILMGKLINKKPKIIKYPLVDLIKTSSIINNTVNGINNLFLILGVCN